MSIRLFRDMSRIERNYEIYENYDFSLWSYEICENDKTYEIS